MADGRRARSVAISRQRGSGGSYVGRAVAERLGLRYFDREMIRIAAEYLTAQEPDPHGKGRLADSWFERFGAALAFGGLDSGYVPPSPTAVYERELFEFENRLIQEIVDDHAAVIVGRGAAQTLRGRPGVVAVFIHAPESWRVDRVQQVYGITDRAEALQMVRRSDRDRAQFLRTVAGVDWAEAHGYDLAMNTAVLGFDAAVDLIVRAVTAGNAEVPGIPSDVRVR